MYLAVIGGTAWFSGALNALIERDFSGQPVYMCQDIRELAGATNGAGPKIAILATEANKDELRRTISDWRKRQADLRIVVRLRSLRPDMVREAMQAGAWGAFSDEDAPETVLNLLKSVANGRVSFPFVDFASLQDDPFEQLTRREKEVLEALSKGWTNTQISDRLGISENTVKYHLKLIYEKLGAKNRSMAVAQYLNHAMS